MKIVIFILAAVVSYLLCGFNMAIVLSKLIYHEDIRTKGSKNPGFTNFKRVYGNRYAWFVFIYDLLKCAVCCAVFGIIMKGMGIDWQLAVAYTGFFCMLGHSYPVQYKFQGGKGFLVCLSTLLFIDWRVGLIATALMVILVLITKYMSLATMTSLVVGSVLLFVFHANIPAAVIFCVCTLFMIYLHRENIVRLINGNEKKFTLGGKKSGDNDDE